MTKTCWWCTKKLWSGGTLGVTVMVDGFPRHVHKCCERKVKRKVSEDRLTVGYKQNT